MGPNQAYKLLHSKVNHKKKKKKKEKKRQPTEWETVFTNDRTDKALVSKIYKQVIQLNNKIKSIQ